MALHFCLGGRARGMRRGLGSVGCELAGASWSLGMVAHTSLGRKTDCHARFSVACPLLCSCWRAVDVDGWDCRPSALVVTLPFPPPCFLRVSLLRL